MPTVDEIRTEWKGIRSALGNLICYIDGKTEELPGLERSWQKGYDCGYSDGLKTGADSVVTDKRELVKAKWADVQIGFISDDDAMIASMLCGNCNRWHNEIYHYGNAIEFAHFCSFCGAKMGD